MRRGALSAVALAALAGCRSNTKYDGIEAELRTRNRELEETQRQLQRARELNRAYEQTRPAIPAGEAPPPLFPGTGCSIREVQLARGTGGVDDDAIPGDEYLMAVLVPSDEDRSPIKAPGRAAIAAWEYGPDGIKHLVGAWDISPEQLRPTWRSGLLATGYFIPLQWQKCPTYTKVRVAVRFTTVDGRTYEADRDISVKPPLAAFPATPVAPPAVRQPLYSSPPPPGVPRTIPPGYEELPPPAGLDPNKP
jgi:outer membrane murein-binding lipoprotein Lpp